MQVMAGYLIRALQACVMMGYLVRASYTGVVAHTWYALHKQVSWRAARNVLHKRVSWYVLYKPVS